MTLLFNKNIFKILRKNGYEMLILTHCHCVES